MADDTELAPVEELDTIDALTEDADADTQADTNDDPIAALAGKMGWAPKDQFRGNPDDWKPADEFILAGKDINRSVSRELKELKGTVDHITRTSATLLEQQLAEQRAKLEARFDEAVESGDRQAAKDATAQISRLEQQSPAAQQSVTPEGQAFAEKHAKWFGKDQEATAYAANRADYYAKQGLSPARQLAAVEQDMRGVFPDYFTPPPKPAPTVGKPGSRTATTTARGKSFHDLPPAAQAVARDMHDRLGIPVDSYVTNYFNQPERKVG